MLAGSVRASMRIQMFKAGLNSLTTMMLAGREASSVTGELQHYSWYLSGCKHGSNEDSICRKSCCCVAAGSMAWRKKSIFSCIFHPFNISPSAQQSVDFSHLCLWLMRRDCTPLCPLSLSHYLILKKKNLKIDSSFIYQHHFWGIWPLQTGYCIAT